MQQDVVSCRDIKITLEQRPSKALRKFGNGRLSIYMKNVPVWTTFREEGSEGVEWTWSELLSFLVSNWAWLLNEQGLPLPVSYPNVLAGTLAKIEKELLNQKNSSSFSEDQRRTLRSYCLRHDLAEAVPGIVLPSFFVVRMGNQMLFSSEKQQLLIPAEDGHHILSQVGDIIYRWMRPFADDGTQALLDAWENRESCVRDIIIPRMHLLARMSKDDFQMLSQRIGSQWNNSWSGSIMQEGEMFAAARMSAGFVSSAQQMDILNAILLCPPSKTEKFDRVSEELKASTIGLSTFGRQKEAYEQGYALAENLRKILSMPDDSPLEDPENFLRDYGVRIQEMKWENSALDALSCWSNAHGPLILLNVGEGRRCSHEYGRRFTLGHEICHLLTDRAHALGLVEVLGGGMLNFVERRANAFAAELLLPRQLAASELRQSNDKNGVFLLYLRDKYKVSRKTAASQIFNSSYYSLLDNDEKDFFYKEVFSGQAEDFLS